MKRMSVVVSMALLAAVVVSACGGGGGAASAAQAWFQAFSQLDIAKIKDLTCEAQKASIEDAFSVLGSSGAADMEALRQLFKIDVSGLKYEEKSVSGSQATVRISGKFKLEAFGQSQEQELDEEVPVVNEGGAWKVCASGLPGG